LGIVVSLRLIFSSTLNEIEGQFIVHAQIVTYFGMRRKSLDCVSTVNFAAGCCRSAFGWRIAESCRSASDPFLPLLLS